MTADYHYRAGRGQGYYRVYRNTDGTFNTVERIADYDPLWRVNRKKHLRAKIKELIFFASIVLNVLFLLSSI